MHLICFLTVRCFRAGKALFIYLDVFTVLIFFLIHAILNEPYYRI